MDSNQDGDESAEEKEIMMKLEEIKEDKRAYDMPL